jgi:hypothetical protein
MVWHDAGSSALQEPLCLLLLRRGLGLEDDGTLLEEESSGPNARARLRTVSGLFKKQVLTFVVYTCILFRVRVQSRTARALENGVLHVLYVAKCILHVTHTYFLAVARDRFADCWWAHGADSDARKHPHALCALSETQRLQASSDVRALQGRRPVVQQWSSLSLSLSIAISLSCRYLPSLSPYLYTILMFCL